MVTTTEAIAAIEDKPEFRHIVSVSGGKDSAALAVYLKEKYPQIPAEYVFCDTGTELPETYEFLAKMEAVLGVEIKRVNALQMMGVREKPGRNAFDDQKHFSFQFQCDRFFYFRFLKRVLQGLNIVS